MKKPRPRETRCDTSINSKMPKLMPIGLTSKPEARVPVVTECYHLPNTAQTARKHTNKENNFVKLTTFIKTYAKYHYDSTETIFELEAMNFIILRPCAQEYDHKRGLWWDSFRNLYLNEPEEYLGIFNRANELYGIVTPDGILRINPEIQSTILNIELEED